MRLLKAQQNHAATIKTAELDGRIAAAEHALSQVDVKTATMQADPQSASMAKVIGADQNFIAALSHAVFAISIELGSGVGFWLVFGHGATSRRRVDGSSEPDVDDRVGTVTYGFAPRQLDRVPAWRARPAPHREPAVSTSLIDRAGAVDLQAVDATPAEIIERFFLEVARRRIGPRVQSMTVWSAYKVWCAQRGYSPVSHAMFGRLARWPKHWKSGTMWYLDCELADGYVALTPASVPKALPVSATKSGDEPGAQTDL